MNGDNLYLLGAFLCTSLVFIGLLGIFVCTSKKQQVLLSVITLFWAGTAIYFYAKDCATYKEVYYLKYTIYYPGNTCTYEVDSCNHINSNSDRGTNCIDYYSIPDKDFYGVRTTAPIIINKITKK